MNHAYRSWFATATRSTPGPSSSDTCGALRTCQSRPGCSNASQALAEGRSAFASGGRVRGRDPVRLPECGAVPIEETAGWPIPIDERVADDCLGPLLDGLRAPVLVEIGRGETRIDGIDPHSREGGGVSDGEHVERRLGRRVHGVVRLAPGAVRVSGEPERADAAGDVDDHGRL